MEQVQNFNIECLKCESKFFSCQCRSMTNASRKASKIHSLRSREDLLDRFWEQIDFLRTSALAYDQGKESEARRLSTVLRILFINSKESNGLFEELNLGKYLKMLNTASGIDPRNVAPTLGLAAMQMSESGGRYIAPLNDRAPTNGPQLLRLDKWLTQAIGKKGANKWSRKDLILWVANTDGGAHVDPKLNQLHLKLSRENGIGFQYSLDGSTTPINFEGNYVLACIRQIAFETDMTVIRHVNQGDIPLAR